MMLRQNPAVIDPLECEANVLQARIQKKEQQHRTKTCDKYKTKSHKQNSLSCA